MWKKTKNKVAFPMHAKGEKAEKMESFLPKINKTKNEPKM